jgi:tetratricopeptide (TPR) repeat protein
MPEPKIKSLTEREAINQIVRAVKLAPQGEAPFALVLGSGFSHGLVPVARELVAESLPLWMKSLEDYQSYDDLKQLPQDRRDEMARDFWQGFVNQNSGRDGFKLPLNPQTSLPDNYSDAYQAAFNPEYDGAVNAPKLARDFQRALMQLNKPRLNAAHFLLASLLGVQPGKTTRRNNLFRARAAFSRLILTTNFDPFLQIALQAVNQLYFMSDTPRLGVSDEIYDDQSEAIHLVYLHGSVHRRDQAATKAAIDDIKKRNATILAPVLERHGVIVLGYSGWDDAIVEALAACDHFDNRLYWCGREADPLVAGAFGARVPEILQKHAPGYVQVASAGSFMVQLYSGLVEGNPRLIENPIGQLRELLDIIDLKELEEIKPPASSGSNAPQLLQSGSAATAVVQKKQSTMELLKQAEQTFFGTPVTDQTQSKRESPEAEDTGVVAVPPVESKSKVEQLLSSAQLALGLGNYEECLKLCNEALAFTSLESSDRTKLLMSRALAHYLSGRADDAVADWSQAIELPNAPVEQVAQALVNRGFTWGQKSDMEKALADYARVIEQLPDAPVAQVAQALFNRGFTWGQKGDLEKALADYTRVIEQLPDAPVAQVAQALVNRGFTWGEKGDMEKALADYARVIEQLSDAPVAQVAQALFNRGVAWGQKGDLEKTLADYTRVIEQLPGAPVVQVAQALFNRGVAWGEKGDLEQALADYTRVIEQLPNAPVEQVAQALVNRGVARGQKGDLEKALADYTRVIEQLSGAPVAQVTQALVNRGVAWGQKGDLEKALADYARVIEQLPAAPVAQVAQALFNRGVAWGQKGDLEKTLADYTRVIEQLPDAPVAQVAQALFNRGVAWGQKGDPEKALADYTQVIEQLPAAPVAQVAQALFNRGVAWGEKGDLEKALADYARVIEQLPDAPVGQVAQALGARGWVRYQMNDLADFLADTEAALSKERTLDFAAFNLGLALLALGRDEDALAAYRAAGEQFPAVIETLGLADLEEAGKKWLTNERAQPVIQLLESFKK